MDHRNRYNIGLTGLVVSLIPGVLLFISTKSVNHNNFQTDLR